MTASPLIIPVARFFTVSGGAALAGGKVYTYQAGTNTPQASYTDYTGSVPNTNPVILDSSGSANIWLNGNYKINVLDSNNVQQPNYPKDDIASISIGSASEYVVLTGSANTYIATPAPPIVAYENGVIFNILINVTNNGPTTINVSALGAIPIVLSPARALIGGELQQGAVYQIIYDGTNFQLSQVPIVAGSNISATYGVGGVTITSNVINTANTFTKAQRGGINTLSYSSTITPDFSLANNYQVVLTGNTTLGNPTNLAAGQSGNINFYQDSTGSRLIAYAWGWMFPNNGFVPTASTVAGSKDCLYYDVQVAATSAVTITIATPGLITWTAHGLKTADRLQLSTTGALPTGLSTATTYWVIYDDANNFWLATSQANAVAGTKIATSGTQSGVHTATAISIYANLVRTFS